MFGYGAAARAAPNFHPSGFGAHALARFYVEHCSQMRVVAFRAAQ